MYIVMRNGSAYYGPTERKDRAQRAIDDAPVADGVRYTIEQASGSRVTHRDELPDHIRHYYPADKSFILDRGPEHNWQVFATRQEAEENQCAS